MSNIKGIDLELLKVIEAQAKARAKESGIKEEPVATPTATTMTPEEEFLIGKPEFKLGANEGWFSDVLGWTPTTIPNIPVPFYSTTYWDVAVRERIPKPDTTYHLNKELVEQVVYGLYSKGTLLLHGPTGTGKTSIVQELAAIFQMPFFRVSCHGQMEQSEFLGTNQVETDETTGTPITKHSDTDTTLACKFGGILCIDEVFRAPSTALMSIQSTLEYPHKLVLQDAQGISRQLDVPLADFRLVCTDNTNGTGDSTGNYTAEVQDISTLNRIRRSVFVPYPTKIEEEALLSKAYPNIPYGMFGKMLMVAELTRASFVSGTIMQTMSIREMRSWCESLEDLRSINKSFAYAVYNRLSDTDKKVVGDIFHQVYGVYVDAN